MGDQTTAYSFLRVVCISNSEVGNSIPTSAWLYYSAMRLNKPSLEAIGEPLI